MKILRILLIFKILIITCSCGTVREGFSNQKKNNSDEFLVEKKSPLVMPPNYSELPFPQITENQNNLDVNKIKDLITNNEDNSNKFKDLDKDFEDSLLKKVIKN
tara:strand:- start:482 stop:793 length:312 start_codon:yes stop_codon:yes gene_type:complete